MIKLVYLSPNFLNFKILIKSSSCLYLVGLWEQLHNTNFKGVEFDGFKKEAGLNAFTLSPQNESAQSYLNNKHGFHSKT